jgi:hypothetical protein
MADFTLVVNSDNTNGSYEFIEDEVVSYKDSGGDGDYDINENLRYFFHAKKNADGSYSKNLMAYINNYSIDSGDNLYVYVTTESKPNYHSHQTLTGSDSTGFYIDSDLDDPDDRITSFYFIFTSDSGGLSTGWDIDVSHYVDPSTIVAPVAPVVAAGSAFIKATNTGSYTVQNSGFFIV